MHANPNRKLLAASLLIASHALALTAGVIAWTYTLNPGEFGTRDHQPGTPTGSLWQEQLSPAQWIQADLSKSREAARKYAAQIDFETNATLDERIRRDHEKRLAGEKQVTDDMAEIRQQSKAFDSLADPATEIRRHLPEGGNPDDLLPIYHSWLRRDRAAAMASLTKRHDLTHDCADQVGTTLRDALGESWADTALSSDNTPYPLRLALASNAGRLCGQHGGLARLLDTFQQTHDSRLRATLVEWFVGWWLVEDPKASARFLATVAPPELRDLLLCGWRSPNTLGD